MQVESKSLTKNYLYNTVFHVLVLLIPLVTTPYVSRILGAENIGKFSFASANVTYFTLFATLGTSIYGQRKIAFFRNDYYKMSQVFWNTFSFRLVFGVISLCLYSIYLFKTNSVNIISILVALNIVNVIFDITWLYQGIESFKKIVIRNTLVRVACLIGIFIFIHSRSDTWKYVLIIVLSHFVGSLSMWWKLNKIVNKPEIIRPFDGFTDIILIFLPAIAIQIYMVLDKSMIGWITQSDYLNGCYEQSEKIVRLAITVITSVGTVVFPRVANLYNNNNLEVAKEYIYKAFRVVWLSSFPVMMGLLAISDLLIPVFLGSNFDLSIVLLKIFSFLVLPVSVANIIGLSYLIPTKQQNVYTFAVSVAAIFNFLLNLFLIARIGAIGAAIASVSAELIGVAIQLYYCIKTKQLGLYKIFKSSKSYLLSSVVMYVIVRLFTYNVGISAFNLVISMLLGIFVYGVCLLLLKDILVLECGKRFLRIINK